MPIYCMQCDSCGKESDIYRAVKDMNTDLPSCCGESMRRKITAPYVTVDIQPYKSTITGEMISSRSQHRAHLKQHNMIEIGNEKPNLKPREVPHEVGGLREELYARISDAKAAA